MLDFIRSHKRLTQIILLVFIIPSFIFVGVEGYKRFGDGDAVAKVNGKAITQQEWDNAQREQAERFRQRAAVQGQPFDSKWIESSQFKWAVLQNLINRRVLLATLNKEHLTVPEQVVLQKIREIPGLIGPDGKLNEARYKEVLAAQGLNPDMHFALMTQDMAMQQIAAPIEFSAFEPKAVVTRVWNLFEQERDVQRLVFDAGAYRNKVSVTEDDLTAFYRAHEAQFTIPEHADVEVVVLDMPTVEKNVKISDADLQSYYEQNRDRFSIPEERRAQHILIAVAKNASDSEKAEAKKKAEELLAQLKADPSRFAELAKAHSQDPGSARNGGDLGFFTRGKMVKPFNDAVFGMKKGEISDPVQTDFGYHLIAVTDIKPAVAKPLSQVKDSVLQELKRQETSKKFAEMSETFSNMVYEKPDSLKPVADALKLTVHTFPNLARDPAVAARQNPLLADPKILQAIFSDDAVKGKHNTEAVEVSPQVLVAARIAKHYPAELTPFEKVKSVVKAQVTNEKAMALAKAAGEAELARLKEGGAPSGFSPGLLVSRQKITMAGRSDLAPVMKADVSKLPAYVGVEMAPNGYIIYRITRVVTPEKTDGKLREAMSRQMTNVMAQQDLAAYMNYLKQEAKVEILVKSPAEEKAEAGSGAAR
ncbi:SurA N-terminal domain-containing protein [Oxalobacter paraformigenes]|uniref:Periplasmic chaperone PpiD n=1 Tax=Oxalobacter paraformigenes TaxID=556268 RepID=C3X4B2_9BURK|nr:SurA N-terminal domain-containing protein [Oxalobacter paraformigenes]EEO28048.1 hypothetical protein OFAG_01201 [Oxalobacter paraformigenes]